MLLSRSIINVTFYLLLTIFHLNSFIKFLQKYYGSSFLFFIIIFLLFYFLQNKYITLGGIVGL